MPLMFLNGGAMRGGPLHHLLRGAAFVATVRTAPRYRFYSVGDRFPALAEVGGQAIQDPKITGPSTEDESLEGVLVEGRLVESRPVEGPSVEGSSVEGRSAGNRSAVNRSMEGWSLEGRPMEGVSVVGELYDVPWDVLRESLLPAEPPELELGVIELEDGSGTLSMIRRRAYSEPSGSPSALYRDISEYADWRSYTASLAAAVVRGE